MTSGPRAPLLLKLYAVGVYAVGLVTLWGLVRWGWPVFDACIAGLSVALLALFGSLWVGWATSARRRQPGGRSEEDHADQ